MIPLGLSIGHSWLPLWGITDPCNRETFGAEIHPALKVNNIWRKHFCNIMRVLYLALPPVPQTLAYSWQKHSLHVTTRSPLIKWQMSQHVVNLSRIDRNTRYSSQGAQFVVNHPHQLSAARLTEQSLSSFFHLYSVDLAQDPRVKQQL